MINSVTVIWIWLVGLAAAQSTCSMTSPCQFTGRLNNEGYARLFKWDVDDLTVRHFKPLPVDV